MEHKKNTDTVQGGEPLVPVEDVGVGTGHTRPLSNYCPAASAGITAEAQKKEGSEAREQNTPDPFRRKSLLGRSPPLRQRARSIPEYLDVSRVDDEEARSAKRKRAEAEEKQRSGNANTSVESRANAIRKKIDEMKGEIDKLSEWAREKNTKREIKEISSKLSSMMRLVMSEQNWKLLQNMGSSLCESCIKTTGKLTQNCGTQTEKVEAVPQTTEVDIGTVKTYEDFAKVEYRRWPQKIYNRTSIIEGTPVDADRDRDLIYLAEDPGVNGHQNNDGIRKKLMERFPDMEDVEGNLAALTISSRMESRGEVAKINERRIFRMELVGSHPEEWYNNLIQLRDKTTALHRTKFALFPPVYDPTGIKTRKMLECILQETEIDATVFVKEKRSKRKVEKQRTREENGAVLIRSSVKSYADLLKEVKDTVKSKGEVFQAKSVRKIRDGSLLIVTSGGLKEADDIKEKIGNINGAVISTNTGMKKIVLQILDIDEITSKEELSEAIKENGGIPEKDFNILTMHQVNRGEQLAQVEFTEQSANMLLQEGSVKVGWINCRIRERVQVQRCFRCLELGHMRYQCKGPDRTGDCYSCGKKGHVAKNCEEEKKVFCLTCKTDGHSNVSNKCPIFRKLLGEAKAKVKRKNRGKKGHS